MVELFSPPKKQKKQLIKISPTASRSSGGNMKDSSTPVAGSTFATGRPPTGRNRGLSVRISEEAYNLIKREKNKSEYIDKLILNDNKKRGRQN